MAVYSRKDRKHVTPMMTATGTTVCNWTQQGLRMWDTNYTQTTHLQRCLMIYTLRK